MSHSPDRSVPPPPSSVRPFRFPAFERLRPAPAVELYLAPLRRSPLVHLELLLPGGGQLDPPGAAGLAAMTAALMSEGTASRGSMAIARAAETLGGYVHASADWDCGIVSTSLLSTHLDEGLDLLLEISTEPAFPEPELERLRRRTLTELRNRRALPSAQAAKALAEGLYGDSPYGGFLLGSEESVRRIERPQVVDFFRGHGAAGPVRLVAAGDLDGDRLMHRLAAAVGTRSEPGDDPPEIRPLHRETVEIRIVDRPGAAQTELRLGLPGLPRSHPDFTVAQLLNAVLGGKFTSRINLNLRERHGYTYGAHSSFSRRLGPGPFVVQTAVANPVVAAATREILGELERIGREPVEPEELDDAKSYLLGVFPYTVQTIEGIASRLAELAVYRLGDDYYDRLPRRLTGITSEEILGVARAVLDPRRALIVAVGPADELRPQLEPLGALAVLEG